MDKTTKLVIYTFIAMLLINIVLVCYIFISKATYNESSVNAKSSNLGDIKLIGKNIYLHTFVFTDPDTNLQYLITYNGGITPRLDENGNHMKKE